MVHRFLALAGSWMSRTTITGSPTTVPITRLSPAGIEVVQRASDGGPVETGLDELLAGDAPADAVVNGLGAGLCAGLDGGPQDASVSAAARAPTRACTAQHYAGDPGRVSKESAGSAAFLLLPAICREARVISLAHNRPHRGWCARHGRHAGVWLRPPGNR